MRQRLVDKLQPPFPRVTLVGEGNDRVVQKLAHDERINNRRTSDEQTNQQRGDEKLNLEEVNFRRGLPPQFHAVRVFRNGTKFLVNLRDNSSHQVAVVVEQYEWEERQETTDGEGNSVRDSRYAQVIEIPDNTGDDKPPQEEIQTECQDVEESHRGRLLGPSLGVVPQAESSAGDMEWY